MCNQTQLYTLPWKILQFVQVCVCRGVVQAALSKFGVHFGVKLIYIHFHKEKYMLFKKKDVSIFFLAELTS